MVDVAGAICATGLCLLVTRLLHMLAPTLSLQALCETLEEIVRKDSGMNEPISFRYIDTNGVSLHTAFTGPEDGEPLVLLHGFPDAWFGWKHQMMRLGDAGFRVIVPDQRGYNLSTKPKQIADYKMDLLVNDIMGLADTLELKQFCLAGHDWGGVIGWMTALRHPERIARLATLNAPHPLVFQQFLRSSPSQMLKSWYILFFQLPAIPEVVLRANNWRLFANNMPLHSRELYSKYRAAWEQPFALTAMLNWYRASLRYPLERDGNGRVSAPTLIVWGQKDRALSDSMAALSAQYCNNSRLVLLPEATHWVMHDEPEAVNKELMEHFSPAKHGEG